jgi:excisionase family DNA binding protein
VRALRPTSGRSFPTAELDPTNGSRGSYQTPPLTVRIPEACRLSGIGRSKFYELIKAHEIEIIKVGTITLVPVESLKAYLGI